MSWRWRMLVVYMPWEAMKEVRDRLRANGKLLLDAACPGGNEVHHDGMKPHMKTLALNDIVLIPLVDAMGCHEDVKAPYVSAIYKELNTLYTLSHLAVTEGKLITEMWDVRKCCAKEEELGTKMKFREVKDLSLAKNTLCLNT